MHRLARQVAGYGGFCEDVAAVYAPGEPQRYLAGAERQGVTQQLGLGRRAL